MPGTQPVFDPRHDAVFQRGYRPGVSPAQRERVSPPTPPPSPTGVGEAAPDAADILQERLRQLQMEADVAGAPLTEVPLTQLKDEESFLVRALWVNPFIISLWVLGPGLVAAGVWVQAKAVRQSFNGDGTTSGEPINVVFQQIVWTTAPAVISAGLITMVGLLFWHAWRWRAARTHAF